MVRDEQIVKNILLKMNYDSSKTLNENIHEQESIFTRNLERIYSNPNTAREYNREMAKFVGENKHTLLDIAAIGAFFIPGVGPLISLGLELANSGLYYAEGDEYMAGFSLAFALIPMGELVAKIPGIEKLGRNGLASIIRKVRLGKELTEEELKVANKIIKESDWVTKTAKKSAKTLSLAMKKLKNTDLKTMIYNVYRFSKKYPTTFNLSKTGLQIGGIWYTYEKLVDIFGIGGEDEVTKPNNDVSSNEEDRIVSDFDRTWDYKKEGDKYYTKRKTSDKWILTKGKAENAIRNKVFGDTTGPSDKKANELEEKFEKNPEQVVNDYVEGLKKVIDTEQLGNYWKNYQ